jgi:uncharacterized protein YwqG
MKAKLAQLISKYKLERVAEKLETIIFNRISISKSRTKLSSNAYKLGCSRMGGLPDLPPDFEWVKWRGRSLNFLAQFNCAELSKYDLDRVLPNSGMLYFFYDLDQQPWGFDPDDRGGSVVIYSPDCQLLRLANLPAGMSEQEFCLPSFDLSFKSTLSTPLEDSVAFEQIGFSNAESENFDRLWQELLDSETGFEAAQEQESQPIHQLLGFSHNIQGDMQIECQMAANGIYCGDGNSAPQAQDLAEKAAEWRLLFQVDSDDDLDIMFGDCGMIYYWIQEAALKEKRFDQTWTILQCC